MNWSDAKKKAFLDRLRKVVEIPEIVQPTENVKVLIEMYDALQAENTRLREALDKIRHMAFNPMRFENPEIWLMGLKEILYQGTKALDSQEEG